MAFLSGWSYRKPVTLSRASGAVTNYQMKLKVGESAGAAGEDVDCDGKCKADFSDLRFTAADGTTLLDYYIEDVSGATPNQLATVWIEFGSIGTGATTFYMYYGNAGASAASNGPATFAYFQDFNALNTADLNGQDSWSGPTNWDVQTTTKYEGAKAAGITGGAYPASISRTLSLPAWNWTLFIQMRFQRSNVAIGNGLEFYIKEGASQVTGMTIDVSKHKALVTPAAWQDIGAPAPSNNVWYKVALALDAKTTHRTWVNDTLYTPVNVANLTNVTTKIDGLMLEQYLTGGSSFVDQILICQWLPTGPAWGSWGAEEPALNHYTLELEPASFSMTGAAVRLLNNKSFIAGPGAFSMIGKNIGMPKALVPFFLEPGAFAMTGAALSIGRPVSYMRMDPGAFSMIGKPVDVKYHWYSGEAGSNYEFQKQRRKF